jgi:hypothetical protein
MEREYRLPPILSALGAQIIVLAMLALLRMLVPFQTPILLWISLQAVGAAAVGRIWLPGPYWALFQIALPMALAWQTGHTAPIWVYPTMFAILLLIYGGGIFDRVPLYNSGLPAWEALVEFIPEGENTRFIDLGAGLGGPLSYIAVRRPKAVLLGVESSPLVWLIGWLRTMRFIPRCSFRLGSIWKTDLREANIVFAFLSPAPMTALWAKARREMRSDALLISHSFEIPGQTPCDKIPLPGKKGAALLIYMVNKP